MPYRIEVRQDLCFGTESCIGEAPDSFRMVEIDGEDKSELITPPGDDEETLMLAAKRCPTEAIVVFDADSGEQLWPPD